MPLRFESRVFTLAKDPEQPSAFQDACCVDCDESVAAIADGVSSALFSGPWAAILVEAAVADLPDPTDAEAFSAWLDHQRAHWSASIDTASLAWHQKAKLASGAFSTLLVVRVVAPEASHEGNFGGHRVLAYGIGDSCLLHIRGGELVRTFPLAKADDFLADPIVLGSIDLKRDHLLQFAFLDEMCLRWRPVDPLHRRPGRMGRANLRKRRRCQLGTTSGPCPTKTGPAASPGSARNARYESTTRPWSCFV